MQGQKVMVWTALSAIVLTAASAAQATDFWSIHDGKTVIQLNTDTLAKYGLAVRSSSGADGVDTAIEVRLEAAPSLDILGLDNGAFSSGEVHHSEGLIFTTST